MKSFMLKRTFGMRTRNFGIKRFHSNGELFWHNVVLAISALVLFGTICRIVRSKLNIIAESPVLLPVALSNFPDQINNWTDQNIQVPKYIQENIEDTDDFLYRFFINKPINGWVNLYVAYSGRPATMLGHRPEMCYVADGWIHENTEFSQFYDSRGESVPCSIHSFHKAGNDYEDIVVLNFYILNGRIVNGERDFSGLGWRIPNLDGDPARYVAQVQISSDLENSIRLAAKEMIGQILDFLPDKNGKVKAANYVDITNYILE